MSTIPSIIPFVQRNTVIIDDTCGLNAPMQLPVALVPIELILEGLSHRANIAHAYGEREAQVRTHTSVGHGHAALAIYVDEEHDRHAADHLNEG